MNEFVKFLVSGAVSIVVFVATASFYFGGEWEKWEEIKTKHETKTLESKIDDNSAKIKSVEESIPTRVTYKSEATKSDSGSQTTCPNPDEVVTGTAGLSIGKGRITLKCRTLKLE